MTDPTHPTWRWEEFDPDRTSMSGDISKLFRNEPIKAPGILAVEAPPSNASVMMREVIQNSWDAARELQSKWTSRSADCPSPPSFEVRFEFKEASGPDKGHLVAALGLSQLAEQRSRFEEIAKDRDQREARRALGLPPESCLDFLLDESRPVRILVITESGTTGMYGRWGVDSRMYLAMCSVGYTPKREGGGSFGYGKAGMIRGSATRTVFAYSCFGEQNDEPGVTRRLLGMTYWGEHRVGDRHYTGFGRFGESAEGKVKPLEDAAADAAARALGLPVRSAENPAEIGTTFLIVDPVVDPDGLRRAAERHWWPALEDPSVDFSVRIKSASGDVLIPRPKRDSVLESFRQAYDLAVHPPPASEGGTSEKRFQIKAPATGTLALTSDLDGWSYPESRADSPQHRDRTLVALVRDPRMVVEYLPVGRESMRPLLRGVFVADPSIDAALRRTEPKGHDCWQTNGEDVDDDDLRVAIKVVERIKRAVSGFRRTLKPSPRPLEEVSLPEFDRVMRQLLTGPGPIPPPPPGNRAFRILPTPVAEAVSTDSIRVAGEAQFGLRDDFEGDECEVEIRLRYAFDEDGSMGSDVKLKITAPEGFERGDRDGTYFGTLVKGHDVTFSYVSDPHSDLWTGRLVATAEQLKVTTA